MCIWKMKILYIFLCLLTTACATPQFKLSEETRLKSLEIPDQIELKFVSDNIWNYTVFNGELLLHNIEDYRPGWRGKRPYINFSYEVPKGLPTIQGFEYHGPYRLSPDNSLMFLSLSSEKERYYPTYFVLIRMEKNEVIFQRNSKYQVEDIAWSPDSSMFAVLEKSSRRSLSPLGIVLYVLAHPIDVCKFYLSIYDRECNLLISTKVASGLVDGRGQVSWEDKGDKN